MRSRSRGKAIAVAAVFLASSHIAALSHDPHQQQHAAAPGANPEDAFLAENDAAMKTMMTAMEVKPSGDVDRDFVAMMTPHHQGAIDMALAVLKYGRNEQLKRIAQEIIVEQQQEIAAMKLAVGDPLPSSGPAPTQIAPERSSTEAMPHMAPNMKM